jgi:hypothetical protein
VGVPTVDLSPSPSRRPLFWAAIVALAVLLLALAFLVFRSGSADSGESDASVPGASASGLAGLGSAPHGSVAPPRGTRPAASTSATAPNATFEPSSAPVGPPRPTSSTVSAAPATLSAAYREPGILGGTYQVIIANKGDAAVSGWIVGIQLSGVNTVVSPGDGVKHEVRAGDMRHMFTPVGALATVPARGSVSFTFTVKGLLPKIQQCTIDDEPCTSSA